MFPWLTLKGKGTITRTTQPGGFNALLSPVPPKPVTRTFLLLLSVQLHGRSGTFELVTTPNDMSREVAALSSQTVNGLLYFESDGNTIYFLERNDKKRKILTAHRKQ